MNKLLHCLLATIALVSATGCRHKLADQPLTPRQREWAEKMDGWNWKWRLPYQAPVRDRLGSSQTEGNGMADVSVPAAQGFPPPLGDLTGAPDLPAVVLPPPPAVGTPLDDVVLVPMDGAADTAGDNRVHRVRKGDTLSKIALQYYGKTSLWRRIYDANRDKIDSPDNLKSGIELNIPPAP